MDRSEAVLPEKKLARLLDFSETAAICRRKSVNGVHPRLPPESLSFRPTVSSTIPQLPSTIKKASPNSYEKTNLKAKKQKQCSCKFSRCLKLYCECFASGIYCNGCNCNDCLNTSEFEAVRKEAIEVTLERNPDAFKPKIVGSPLKQAMKDCLNPNEVIVPGIHNKGCNCKKSGCRKRYCECFQADVLCSLNCKCTDCKNFEKGEEQGGILCGVPVNGMKFYNRANNASITQEVVRFDIPATKRRKTKQNRFKIPSLLEALPRLQALKQETRLGPSCGPLSPLSIHIPGMAPASRSKTPESMYRSQMLSILQPQHIKELCSFMVVLSTKTAKEAGETNHVFENAKDKDQLGTSHALLSPETKRDHNQDEVSNSSMKNSNKIPTYAFASPGFDLRSVSSASPETLPLLSNERNTTNPNIEVSSSDSQSQGLESEPREQIKYGRGILASQVGIHMNQTGILESNVCREEPVGKPEQLASQVRALGNPSGMLESDVSAQEGVKKPERSTEAQVLNMTYGEQERLVLTSLCDFLKKLIRN